MATDDRSQTSKSKLVARRDGWSNVPFKKVKTAALVQNRYVSGYPAGPEGVFALPVGNNMGHTEAGGLFSECVR